ncbi:MAG: hypothetical protein JWO46_1303 [Nocardioidaceae bacterium]|nr:hypothetical protein [Nocardioidaceae bacterium]
MAGSTPARLEPRPRASRCPGYITDLLLRCAQGESTALGRLFDVLHPLVQAMVEDGTRSARPDDVVVEVFGRLWRQAPTYDPKTRTAVGWVIEQTRAVIGPRQSPVESLIA